MSGFIDHTKVSAKSDDADPTKIQPTDWNDHHKMSGGNHGALPTRDTTDATYGGSWLLSVAAGMVLASAGAGVMPAWTDRPLLAAFRSSLTRPTGLVDGTIWLEATGTSPNRTIALMCQDLGVVRTLLSIKV